MIQNIHTNTKYVLFSVFFLLFNSLVPLNPNTRAHQFLHSKMELNLLTFQRPLTVPVQQCMTCHSMKIIHYNTNMTYVVCTAIYSHLL
jgi:hypothetical protein